MFKPWLKPEVETKSQTFTPDLKGLIAWLRTQDGATKYNYESHNDCLLCRFVNATDPEVFPNNPWLTVMRIDAGKRLAMSQAAYGPIWKWKFGGNGDCTYSAALSRAIALSIPEVR